MERLVTVTAQTPFTLVSILPHDLGALPMVNTNFLQHLRANFQPMMIFLTRLPEASRATCHLLDGLAESDRWDIVNYIKRFCPIFQKEDRTPIVLPPGPLPATARSVNRGHELYELLDCAKCHSLEAMEPNGLYEQGELRDRRGLDLLPRDLSRPSSFKNGHRPQDIAKSILTGLDDTPMPSFREALSSNPEDICHLVNYLLSASQHQE